MNQARINFMKLPIRLLIAFSVIIFSSQLKSYVSVALPAAAQCAAYDRPNGVWYVGTAAVANFTPINKVTPASGATPLALTTFPATTSLAVNSAVSLMALSQKASSSDMRIAFVPGAISTSVGIANSDGTITALSAALKDGGGTNDTAGIVAMAASDKYIFVAGAVNAGRCFVANGFIRAISINDASLALTIANNSSITGANSIVANAAAINMDPVAGGVFAVQGACTPETGNENNVALHWNQRLSTLYVGVSVGGGSGANEIVRSLAIFNVNSNGQFTFQKTNTAEDFSNTGAVIVGDKMPVSGGSATSLSIRKLSSMVTSTGKDYLIVNGGVGTFNTVGNKVYALPLVGSGTEKGTMASCAALSNENRVVDFVTQAANAAALLVVSNSQAIVGNGSLPIAAASNMLQLECVGDTVYASIDTASVSGTGESSIYYSQAIFDNTGQIVAWSDWAKAVPAPLTGDGTNNTSNNALKNVSFFAVDASTGSILTIPTPNGAVTSVGGAAGALMKVEQTQWAANDGDATSLLTNVNSKLNGPCYAACVIGQHSSNYGNANLALGTYALFGGDAGKIVVATMGSLTAAGTTYVGSKDTQTVDFSAANMVNDISIPNAGAINSIEFSKLSTTAAHTNAFIWAGTTNGLYVRSAAAGAGVAVTPADFTDSATGLFASTGIWTKIATVTGDVRKIKFSGNYLYVLARDTNLVDGTVADKLYVINSSATGTVVADFENIAVTNGVNRAFNGAMNPLAISGVVHAVGSDLSAATQIYDFAVLNAATAVDRVVLATNAGLYVSNIATGINNSATAASALWAPANDSSINVAPLSYGLHGAQITRRPQTVWCNMWVDGDDAIETFTYGMMNQIGFNKTAASVSVQKIVQYDPVAGAVSPSFDATAGFALVLPIQKFFSDGARRFFIDIPESSKGLFNSMRMLPFDVSQTGWNLTDPVGKIQDLAVQNSKLLYWVMNIGSGYIAAGTDKGIIALQ